jgi:type IV secretion system protein VirD4
MSVGTDISTAVGVGAFLGAGLIGSDRTWLGRVGPSGHHFGAWRPGLPPPGRQVPSTGARRGFRAPRSISATNRTARWARAADLRPLVVGKVGGADSPPVGRLVLGTMGRRLIATERAQSVIVIGPTQSRKTSGFAVPAIMGWEGPVIAASVKSDLLEHTVDHRSLVGAVWCFDPSGSTGMVSASWSPLPASRTWPGARRAASALTEVAKSSAGSMTDGDFWYATAARMLGPLLFAAAFGGGDMDDVIRWVDTQEEDEVLHLLEATGVEPALHVARSLFGKEERQRSSIYTTVETILEPFAGLVPLPRSYQGASTSAGPASSLAHPPVGGEIDPATLLHGTNTLYLCAPAHDQRRLMPLFVSVIRQIVEYAYDHVSHSRRPLEPPLLIVLDEAANIAPLSDLDSLAATAAGHGIQLVTVWHDMAQIHARYGQRSTTVVNNHRAKLFLSGISDPSTLDYASHLIGEEEIVLPSVTLAGRGSNGGPSTTHSQSVRRLAAPDVLRRTPPGEAVLLYGDLPPARLRLRTRFETNDQKGRKPPRPE